MVILLPEKKQAESRRFDTANQVNDTANQANDTANQANDTANQVNDTANQANDTANQANDTANQANDTANQANDTANQANDTANQVCVTANSHALSSSFHPGNNEIKTYFTPCPRPWFSLILHLHLPSSFHPSRLAFPSNFHHHTTVPGVVDQIFSVGL